MQYDQLERDFLTRTLKLLEQYDEMLATIPDDSQFEQTLLINCLVGLLLLPKERWKAQMSAFTKESLADWQIPASAVASWGCCKECRRPSDQNFGQFVRRLRNAVAHMRLEARGDGNEVQEWQFTDQNGFEAVLATNALRGFVTRTARRLLPV